MTLVARGRTERVGAVPGTPARHGVPSTTIGAPVSDSRESNRNSACLLASRSAANDVTDKGNRPGNQIGRRRSAMHAARLAEVRHVVTRKFQCDVSVLKGKAPHARSFQHRRRACCGIHLPMNAVGSSGSPRVQANDAQWAWREATRLGAQASAAPADFRLTPRRAAERRDGDSGARSRLPSRTRPAPARPGSARPVSTGIDRRRHRRTRPHPRRPALGAPPPDRLAARALSAARSSTPR